MSLPVIESIYPEKITTRFLIHDIPLDIELEELATELEEKNNFSVSELRQFVGNKNSALSSPVLVAILGTIMPEYAKLWLTRQKSLYFFDKPQQCKILFNNLTTAFNSL
ncbi:hypothetical protein CDAR_17721 [Caerostris darwini]|uniref:Uncharacterized protein n=1 Tax=Caerostris darwini TaxID=1538125 RepID=A0AAV4MBU4_9ARAC|nr:hypothetical protein CDAR_17721 [Caerostris darwini]